MRMLIRVRTHAGLNTTTAACRQSFCFPHAATRRCKIALVVASPAASSVAASMTGADVTSVDRGNFAGRPICATRKDHESFMVRQKCMIRMGHMALVDPATAAERS